ncbi:hypothetical protein [Devosia sp. CAU 1758]
MTSTARTGLVQLIAGFLVWSLAFVVLYALQALGCALGWGMWHRPLLIAAYLTFLVPMLWLATRPRSPHEPADMLSVTALWANRAALLAGVLVFMPVTFASLCT